MAVGMTMMSLRALASAVTVGRGLSGCAASIVLATCSAACVTISTDTHLIAGHDLRLQKAMAIAAKVDNDMHVIGRIRDFGGDALETVIAVWHGHVAEMHKQSEGSCSARKSRHLT